MTSRKDRSSLVPGNEPQPSHEPTDDMIRSEPLGDDGLVVETENVGPETPGGGEFPDRDTPPSERAGADSGSEARKK